MTTINRTLYPIQNSVALIGKLQDRFASLQQQLATGQKASNLAELGSDRYFDLSIRSKMSQLSGYADSITMVNLRLAAFDQTTTQLDKVEADARSAITPSAYGTDDINFGTVPSLGRANLDQVLTLLNTDVNGRYLFSGSTTDKPSVATTSEVIDGAGGKAGFAQVAMERQQADVGNGMGRLTASVTGSTVSLAEDGAHPFGFKLSTLTASSGAVALTQPTGTAPQSLGVTFNSVPTAGDTVTIGLTLPDGSADGIMLKAVTGTPGAGEFQIGADATTTAANFNTAMQSALTAKGGTTLVAASNNAAADNFFNGQGQSVMRVQGPNFATATQLVAADPTTTVMWYKGADAANARTSVTARVDDTQTVAYGAQANESGPLNLVRGLAVLAIQNFSTSDPTSEGRFDAIASRNLDRLSESHNSEPGSIEMMGVELSNAQATTKTLSDRHSAYSAQLEGLLGGIENVQPEDIAMQILALQTQLTASYQTTSLVSKLSLVNYLK